MVQVYNLIHSSGDFFTYSCKTSMKAVLLHNYNTFKAMRLSYAVDTTKNKESITFLPEAIKYKIHEWQICCDLKVAALTSLQEWFTK